MIAVMNTIQQLLIEKQSFYNQAALDNTCYDVFFSVLHSCNKILLSVLSITDAFASRQYTIPWAIIDLCSWRLSAIP